MKSEDVLIMCQFFYPEYVSSATYPFDTAMAFSKAGYSVGVVCGYPKEYVATERIPVKEEFNGIKICRVKYLQLKRSTFIGRIINFFSLSIMMLTKINVMKRYKTIIVYSNPPVLPLIAVLVKKIYHTKVVFVSYDVYPEIAEISNTIGQKSVISKVMTFINKLIFKNAEKVVAVSSDMKEYLEKKREISQTKVISIPNWFECVKHRDKMKALYNPLFKSFEESDFIVSYLGNMGTCQEFDTILGAIRETKDNIKIKYVFAGHGNKLPLLQTIVREEGLNNVFIYDFLQGDDFDDILEISSCFIVTLIPGLKGLCAPSKTYSYMAAGKPIIAVVDEEMEIATDITENKCGFLIHHNDCKTMSMMIKKLSSDTKLLNEMKNNSLQVFLNKYEKRICLNHYLDLISDILEGEHV